jgi:hypothetical protein
MAGLPARVPLGANPGNPSADDMVRRADLIRVPDGSYELEITVTDFVGEKNRGAKGYRSFVKDLSHTLVEFRSPTSERGKSMLMLDDDVWVYLPNIKKPIRVPLKQRLLGQVAIGDMIRTNFSQDYTANVLGEDKLEGTDVYVLELQAKSQNKSYQKIKYWIAKEDFRPLMAEYFSASGTPLKTLTFKEFRIVEGENRPMVGIFRDSVQKDKVTELRFDKLTRKTFQDMMFSKQYMQTLE